LAVVGLSLVVIAMAAAGCGDCLTAVGQEGGISVTGEGEVSVTPDLASLNIGVEAQAKTVELAQQQARQAMDAVSSELEGRDIAEEDIQTQYFSIYPVWQWDDGSREQVLVGYRVTNTVTVKIRDVEAAAEIIDAVTDAGGNYIRISGIDFTVDDPTAYYEEVREKAMNDAKAKAEQLADLGGVGLGKPKYITEGGVYAPVVRQDYAKAEDGGAPVPTTIISPGEVEIRLSVQVVYGIE
ncbi:SIMPL domain-containing protein, partial [Chloroflexota bacterium]